MRKERGGGKRESKWYHPSSIIEFLIETLIETLVPFEELLVGELLKRSSGFN